MVRDAHLDKPVCIRPPVGVLCDAKPFFARFGRCEGRRHDVREDELGGARREVTAVEGDAVGEAAADTRHGALPDTLGLDGRILELEAALGRRIVSTSRAHLRHGDEVGRKTSRVEQVGRIDAEALPLDVASACGDDAMIRVGKRLD